MPETHQYRVVYRYDDGVESATVPFDNVGYATKLWTRANASASVARCWIERRTVSDWKVNSSETGQEFMALAPRDQEAPAFPCVSCGAGCSGRYDAEGHREGYCLKCGETQQPLSPRETDQPKEADRGQA